MVVAHGRALSSLTLCASRQLSGRGAVRAVELARAVSCIFLVGVPLSQLRLRCFHAWPRRAQGRLAVLQLTPGPARFSLQFAVSPSLPWQLAAAARFLWCARFAGHVPSPVVSSPRALAVDLAWPCIIRLVNHGHCRACLSLMSIARYLDLADWPCHPCSLWSRQNQVSRGRRTLLSACYRTR
jgi:hypothetical protein